MSGGADPKRAGRSTIEEVAAAAGVSRSTVSRVVNGSTAVSPHALAAVHAAIERLGYVPNRAARTLASRQTHAIALVVPEDTTRFFGDPFFAAVVAGISDRIARSDYILNLLVASDDAGGRMTGFVRNGGVDGAIILSHHMSDVFVDRIVEAVPAVFGGRPTAERAADFIVDVDNVAGARAATEHLLGSGRTRLATITGPLSMAGAVDRLQGFREALADAGLEPFAERDGDYTEEGGAAAARAFLAVAAGPGGSLPDAIFAASDLMARGALQVLRSAGIRIPEDVAIVGYDDSPVAVSTDPPLTTIRQPMHAQGEAMASVLIDLLAGAAPPHRTILDIELVVRGSA
ncbi:LacI family DNA-binding transcriptional regulator [Microbacterium capsulatum]|uniref:LacI family DNA-binding transcriptional regulator n=1 Tax=Microbacterium capsulatum TaxID=3041921 RepID=A0ABU0XK17_9MICO|nr:LacI family DNA-binding transcriptional regulator [Microbacterium sp. ASV81]MDQ4214984.1 LacI family DNA-binding transcriptional regulator [Microbacterium sp. ASV81]